MKFLFDYFPIICFFIVYKLYGIYVATAATIAASALQVGFYWLKNRKFEKLHLITLALVFFLGGSTLIFHKVIFIKWKPSIIYWMFALVLVISQFFSKKSVLQRMLGDKIALPNKVWARLNLSWAIFFTLLGGLNLWVVYHFNTNTWVNFKLFGTLGLTLLFVIIQAFYMARHIEHTPGDDAPDKLDTKNLKQEK